MIEKFKNTATLKKSIVIPTIVILSLYFLFNANLLSAQWQMYHTGLPQWSILNDIQFVNELTGYSVGELSESNETALFIKSTNGGINWIRYSIHDSTSYIAICNKVYFLNDTIGYIIGRSINIYRTTNGGLKWTPSKLPITPQPVSMVINDITFPSQHVGYVAGRYGHIAKTIDAGNTWDTIYKSPYSEILTIHFFDEHNGIAGDAAGGIYRTKDGGANWSYEQLMFDNYVHGFFNMSFISNDIGFMFGYTFSTVPSRYIFLKTSNGGTDWFPVSLFLNEQYRGIHFFDENKGFITGQGKIKFTDDGGQSWQDIFPNNGAFPEYYSSISFLNDEIGFLSGTSANVYKTITGGVSVQNISTEIPPGFSLHQNFPNPFNPSTTISFDIPQSALVKLTVYDALGREVATLVNENLTAGVYQYQFSIDNFQLGSGVYFYRLQAGEFVETKRLVLLK